MRRRLVGVLGISLCTGLAGQAGAQTTPPPAVAQPGAPGVVNPAAPPAAAPVAPPVQPAQPIAPAPATPPAASPQPVPPPVAPVAPAPATGLAPAPAVTPQPAQPAPVQPVPAQPVPVQPVPAQPVPVQPAPGQAVPAAPAPAPVTAEGGMVLGTGGSLQLEPPPVDVEPAPVAAALPWYDQLQAKAFVDAYFSYNANGPKPQDRNRFRAFDPSNGFGLSWAGLDLSLAGDEVGGTVALRFGPSAVRWAGADAAIGLQFVKQAYATWRPGGKDSLVTLDLGKFDTIVGAEVADSQLNFNYTRGLLFWLAQPSFHTGLRANFAIAPQFWITALAANGWSNSLDQNAGKTFGVQLNTAVPAAAADAPPVFDAHLSYLVGPEQLDWGTMPCAPGELFDLDRGCVAAAEAGPNAQDFRRRDAGDANTALRHLIDLVMGVHPTPALALVLNADLGFESWRDPAVLSLPTLPGFETQSWWGVSLLGRYQFNPQWAAAVRGEIVGDPDARATADGDPYVFNVPDLQLYSGTLTGEFAPVSNLVLRLDARLDAANEEVFPVVARTYGSTQFTATLGAVITTN